ncbi:unnamed protein product [Ectocarpus sp. 12 AP-2014]
MARQAGGMNAGREMPEKIRNRGRTGATILPAEREARCDPAYPRLQPFTLHAYVGEEGETHPHVEFVVAKACSPHGALRKLLVFSLFEGDVQRTMEVV